MEDETSLKQRLRTSSCFSCCFGGGVGGGVSGRREGVEQDERPRFVRNTSSWLRSRAQELPEIRDRCRNLMSRIGRSRRGSNDFRYDPLSYALNFDDGSDDSQIEEFRHRNFSTRLPPSPPPVGVSVTPEIACV